MSLRSSRSLRSRSLSNRRSNRGRSTLRGQSLEGRDLMAVFTWTGATNSSWFTSTNWSNGGGIDNGTAGVPDAGDSVIFNNGAAPAASLTGPVTLGNITFSNGTLNLGATLTTNTADFSANTGVLNAAANPLVVTNELQLTPTTAAVVSGGSVSVAGTNIANDTVTGANARALTVSNGATLRFQPVTATGISYFKVTGDADSQISTNNIYTHAINPSGGGEIVNGVHFGGVGAGVVTAASGSSYLQGGTTPTAIGNLIGTSNFGVNAIGTNFGGWGNASGNILNMYSHFNYNTAPLRSVILTGLQPNTTYSLRTYEKQWDTSLGRTYTLGYDVGNNGSTEFTTGLIDQNHPESAGAVTGIALGQQDAWVDNFVYRTGPTDTSIRLDINNSTTATYHFYALSNQVVSTPTISLPNTRIFTSGTASVDLTTSNSASAFQNLSVPANTVAKLYSVGEDASLNVAAPGVLAGTGSTAVIAVQGTAMPGNVGTSGDGNVATTATGGGALNVLDTGAFTYTPGAGFNATPLGQNGTASFTYDEFPAPLVNAAATGGTQSASGFTVSSTDLINGLVPAVTAGSIPLFDGTSGGPNNLTNGVFGSVGSGAPGFGGAEATTIQNNTTLEYTLPANTLGYTITSVAGYTSWQDAGREDVRYSIEVQTVGNGATWTQVANVQYNNGNPPSPTSSRAVASAAGGIGSLATNVTKIRFVFGGQDNNYAGYRELDVFGFATAAAPAAVTVIGANDPPTVTAGQSFSIAENSPNGTVVGTVAAADTDTGGTITGYAITGGTGMGAFAISASGQITVSNSAALNFEATPSLTLNVQATDNNGATGTATVTINLTNVNEAPSIAPQTFTVAENVSAGTLVGTIVASDPDAGDSITYAVTGGSGATAFAVDPVTGDITVVDGSQIDFETNPSFTLDVSVTDESNVTSTATITIDVEDLYIAIVGDDVVVDASDLSDKITITPVAGGNFVRLQIQNADGIDRVNMPINANSRVIIYGNGGNDQITHSVKDVVVEIHGGDGNDKLSGSNADDSLYGDAGADTITGGIGNDLIEGGDGNDKLDASAGDDVIYGGAGSDSITGNTGNDVIFGGNDSDRTLAGVAGDDVIFGDGPNDSLGLVPEGDASPNTMGGGTGNDLLVGGGANDRLNGDGGNDILIGGLGADYLTGAAGDDVLVGGTTDYDSGAGYDMPGVPNTNLEALLSIMDEWVNGSGSVEDRRDNLINGSGLTNGYTFDPSSSVQNDDGSKDTLIAGANTDWILASLAPGQVDAVQATGADIIN